MSAEATTSSPGAGPSRERRDDTTPSLRATPPHAQDTSATDIVGQAWCFGDHVNTDVIHPPEFFSLDPERVKVGLFHKLDPELHKRFRPGDIIVGGRNFGCGSSRETSIRCLKLNRVGAIVAIDFARIFFRNATNNGIPCLTFKNPFDVTHVWPGERLRISLATWTLTTECSDRIEIVPVSDFILRIWRAGGLLETLSPTHTAAGGPHQER
ncbi:MAG: aconitate hydratase [Proteobacteria bacterium]|nr:MAG: aconitate hydratase [Pseudomonadota bacterium]